MRDVIGLVLAVVLLAACAPEPVEIPVTRLIEVTRPVEITREVVITRYVVATKLIEVTPIATQGPTRTPAPTFTPRPTIDRLKASRGSGFYLIGVDIAPGVWRSEAGHENCYWSRNSKSGDILDNHFGMSGGTVYLRSSDYSIELDDCGTWTWLSD